MRPTSTSNIFFIFFFEHTRDERHGKNIINIIFIDILTISRHILMQNASAVTDFIHCYSNNVPYLVLRTDVYSKCAALHPLKQDSLHTL